MKCDLVAIKRSCNRNNALAVAEGRERTKTRTGSLCRRRDSAADKGVLGLVGRRTESHHQRWYRELYREAANVDLCATLLDVDAAAVRVTLRRDLLACQDHDYRDNHDGDIGNDGDNLPRRIDGDKRQAARPGAQVPLAGLNRPVEISLAPPSPPKQNKMCFVLAIREDKRSSESASRQYKTS